MLPGENALWVFSAEAGYISQDEGFQSFAFRLEKHGRKASAVPCLGDWFPFSILVFLAFSLLLWNALQPLLSHLSDPESYKQLFRQWQNGLGPWVPAAFVLVHAFQVVAAPIAGEVTGILAGFLFGVYAGFFYSMVGLILGSCLDFYLGKWLEKYFLHKVIPAEILENFGFLLRKEGRLIAFLLFLLPGFPKDFLCYFLGMTPMTFRAFLVVMAAGRAPATWMLALQGAQIARANYPFFWGLTGATGILLLVLYACRKRRYEWIRRRSVPTNFLVN